MRDILIVGCGHFSSAMLSPIIHEARALDASLHFIPMHDCPPSAATFITNTDTTFAAQLRAISARIPFIPHYWDHYTDGADKTSMQQAYMGWLSSILPTPEPRKFTYRQPAVEIPVRRVYSRAPREIHPNQRRRIQQRQEPRSKRTKLRKPCSHS